MLSTMLPRRLNNTESTFDSPKIMSIIGIAKNEPEILQKYAWNYQPGNITPNPPPKPPKLKETDGIKDETTKDDITG